MKYVSDEFVDLSEAMNVILNTSLMESCRIYFQESLFEIELVIGLCLVGLNKLYHFHAKPLEIFVRDFLPA